MADSSAARAKLPFVASGGGTLLAVGAIVLAGIAAYSNSFSGPLIFDDLRSIGTNATLERLWPIGPVLAPPPGTTVSGRPLLNLTLALNHALGGTQVWGYHLVNLAIHLAAGLALFGILRRTAARVGTAGSPALAGYSLALAAALLWTVHPLQTESVTYLSQRAESLMGLFYLLTLYCFIRGAEGGRRWRALSVAACAAGMASKEVMVTAPLIVLLYDRTFVAGSFASAWRQRRAYYAGLAASWGLLAALMASAGGNRNGSIGFGTGVAWWAYALTQFSAITRYLRLAVWPHPLVFEYGTFWVRHARELVPHLIVVGALVLGTLVATRRRAAVGFLGCWFFLILAPTSSVVPGSTQMIVEHRMYLPLAAVVVLGVWSLHAALRRLFGPGATDGRIAGIFLPVTLVLAAGGGSLTWQRNADYRSEVGFWRDNVAKRPANPVAHENLGVALARAGKLDGAWEQFEEALRIAPDDASALNDDGAVLVRMGRLEEAAAHFEAAVRLKPDYADAQYNLGAALAQMGRFAEAVPHYVASLKARPDDAKAHNDLGAALAQLGRTDEALTQFEAAVRLEPGYADARYNLGAALAEAGRLPEAIGQLEEAVRLRPDDEQARALLEGLKEGSVR